jgi:hypothetical protein
MPRPLVDNRLDAPAGYIHTSMSMINATPQQLRKAADIQEKILSLQKELGELLGGPGEAVATEAPKKRRMSAAGLANIRAGVRKRMLAQGKAKVVKKPKRNISAAAKARLSRLAKARWAAAKKAGKSRL